MMHPVENFFFILKNNKIQTQMFNQNAHMKIMKKIFYK